MIQAKPVTADELLRMPDDGFRYELVKGELRKMPPAGHHHGEIVALIAYLLMHHVKTHSLGKVYAAETGFKLAENPDTVRAPDVAFIGRERLGRAGSATGYWPGAPDLAVEVVSPNDAHTEVMEKALQWLEAGARMVLVVEPAARTVTVYRSLDKIRILTEGDTLEASDVVPGWKLRVAELFASSP
jgi:Uma2 family endonuclease